MKLYDVPNYSYIRVIEQEVKNNIHQSGLSSEVKVPPSGLDVNIGELIQFINIDGMYSLCYKIDQDTLKPVGTCHLAAWTDVDVILLNDLFTFEQIREMIGRSGYGKDGKGKYRQAVLKDMSDEWIQGAIDYVPTDHPHLCFYKQELEYRKEYNICIPDEN